MRIILLLLIILSIQGCADIRKMRYSNGFNISINLSGKPHQSGGQNTKSKKRSDESVATYANRIGSIVPDTVYKSYDKADLHTAGVHNGRLYENPELYASSISPGKQSIVITASLRPDERLIQNQPGVIPYRRVSNYTKASIVLSLLTGTAFYFAFIYELYFFWFPVGIIALICLYLAIRGIRQIRRRQAGGWFLAVLSVLLALANYALAGVLLLGAIFKWLFP